MALKKYKAIVDGVETVLKLSVQDAERLGLVAETVEVKAKPVADKAAPAPRNKSKK